MTKTERRKMHRVLNALSHDQVAAIVRQQFPRAKGARVDSLAKQVIAGAHRVISPRKIQRG